MVRGAHSVAVGDSNIASSGVEDEERLINSSLEALEEQIQAELEVLNNRLDGLYFDLTDGGDRAADHNNNFNEIDSLLERMQLLNTMFGMMADSSDMSTSELQQMISLFTLRLMIDRVRLNPAFDDNIAGFLSDSHDVPLDSACLVKIGSVKYVDGEGKNNQCYICLDEFKVDEDVRVLKCNHGYHMGCIDPWFKLRPCCPVCKKDMRELYV